MGASSSTRRLIVEEDEKGGGFLIQVSDTVAKQIYGINEKPKAIKSNEPLKRKLIVEDKRKIPAVEAPSEKPQLPVPSFPVVPVIPTTPILAPPVIHVPGSPQISPISTVPKIELAAKDKEQKPVESKGKEEKGKVEKGKVEKTTHKEAEKEKESISATPVLSSKVEKTTHIEAEKKESILAAPVLSPKVEKITPKETEKKESILAAPKVAATVPSVPEPSVKSDIPGPKIPYSSILQPLIRSPAASKTEPVVAPAPAITVEEKAVTAESKEKELIAMERNHIYKQMNEIYVEREKAFRSIEEFYQDKMKSLQNQSSKMNSATRQEFAKAVAEVENKFLKHVEAPVCEDLQLKVLECYRSNQSHSLSCSSEVHAFATAVDQARQPVVAPAPAITVEEKAVTAESKEKELIAMERNHIYKQMNEIYVEREKAFRSIEEFYQDKMKSLQNQSSKMNSATRQEFAKAVAEVENKFLKHVEAPVCEDLQLKVLECYRSNQSHSLSCSSEVHAFATAVDQARQNVILAKKV